MLTSSKTIRAKTSYRTGAAPGVGKPTGLGTEATHPRSPSPADTGPTTTVSDTSWTERPPVLTERTLARSLRSQSDGFGPVTQNARTYRDSPAGLSPERDGTGQTVTGLNLPPKWRPEPLIRWERTGPCARERADEAQRRPDKWLQERSPQHPCSRVFRSQSYMR